MVEQDKNRIDTDKLKDKATDLAGQAAAAAGPLKDRAAELAAQAAAAAGPLAAQAKEKATELAAQAAVAAGPLKERAEELAAKAGEKAAHGVSTLAENLDKATGGKYSDKISSVTSKLEERLDPDDGPPAP